MWHDETKYICMQRIFVIFFRFFIKKFKKRQLIHCFANICTKFFARLFFPKNSEKNWMYSLYTCALCLIISCYKNNITWRYKILGLVATLFAKLKNIWEISFFFFEHKMSNLCKNPETPKGFFLVLFSKKLVLFNKNKNLFQNGDFKILDKQPALIFYMFLLFNININNKIWCEKFILILFKFGAKNHTYKNPKSQIK